MPRPDFFPSLYSCTGFQIAHVNAPAPDIMRLGTTLQTIRTAYWNDYWVIPDPSGSQRLKVYVYPFGANDRRGAFASSSGTIDIDQNRLTGAILPSICWHEIYHLLQFRFGFRAGDIQGWMYEGSAVWAEVAYAKRISKDNNLTAWFANPDTGITELGDSTLPPNKYSAAPLFAYLYVRAGQSKQKVAAFWHAFHKARTGVTGKGWIEAWTLGLTAIGLGTWPTFYTSFLASRFTAAWTTPTPYYVDLQSETGGPIAIVPDFSTTTVARVSHGFPCNESYTVQRNDVKTVRLRPQGSDESYLRMAVTPNVPSTVWARSVIARDGDRTVGEAIVVSGAWSGEVAFDPSAGNGYLFTFVGDSSRPTGYILSVDMT